MEADFTTSGQSSARTARLTRIGKMTQCMCPGVRTDDARHARVCFPPADLTGLIKLLGVNVLHMLSELKTISPSDTWDY